MGTLNSSKYQEGARTSLLSLNGREWYNFKISVRPRNFFLLEAPRLHLNGAGLGLKGLGSLTSNGEGPEWVISSPSPLLKGEVVEYAQGRKALLPGILLVEPEGGGHVNALRLLFSNRRLVAEDRQRSDEYIPRHSFSR